MKKYDKEAALDYIRAAGAVTLGSLQKELYLSSTDAKKLVWGLVEEGLISHSVGFVFRPTTEALVQQETRKKVENKKPLEEKEEQRPIQKKSIFDDDDEDFNFDKWWDEIVVHREEDDDD